MILRRIFISLAISVCAIAATAANFTGKPGGVTSNDDSCDIAVTPAATLLLPYFEVDFDAPAPTTLFTVMNISRQPQLARVTLWTDWAFPAYSFDLFLTGFGVESINMRDLFVSGRLPSTPMNVIPGSRSDANFTNPNHRREMVADCALRPQSIPPASLADLRSIFTVGRPAGTMNGCNSSARTGGTHTNAIGYATIDVVATCSTRTPNDPAYYTTDLLFDNVLTGDYQYVVPKLYDYYSVDAGGNPLVHIRAVPEGGPAGTIASTNLPYTFYDRFTKIGAAFPRTIDRRQPLPATFAARFVQGTIHDFQTKYMIWREGYTGGGAACARYSDNSAQNGSDVIRFDEHENSFSLSVGAGVEPVPIHYLSLPATSSTDSISSVFPYHSSNDVGGWMYINLSNGGSPAYSTERQSQNWIIVRMAAAGSYAFMLDAAPLGNGCSPSPDWDAGVGPAANTTP